MGDNKETMDLDWELSADYYKENENRRELKLEDFMEEEATESGMSDHVSSLGADVQRVAADVRKVKELARQGRTVMEIAGMLGTEQQYVSDILICVQSFPEDNDIAVAHLILMG